LIKTHRGNFDLFADRKKTLGLEEKKGRKEG